MWKFVTLLFITTFVVFIKVTYATTNISETKPLLRCNTYLMGGIDEPSRRGFIFMSNISESDEVEIWKDIAGYEGLYKVSSLGNILSLKRSNLVNRKNGSHSFQKIHERKLRSHICNGGYLTVSLYNKEVGKKAFLLHRIVAKAFVENPHNKPTVNHKYGNKLDNRASSLEWLTYEEQIEHAQKNGLTNYRKSKVFTEQEIIDIRNSKDSFTGIAKKYGVYPTTISNIVKRVSWKKVK